MNLERKETTESSGKDGWMLEATKYDNNVDRERKDGGRKEGSGEHRLKGCYGMKRSRVGRAPGIPIMRLAAGLTHFSLLRLRTRIEGGRGGRRDVCDLLLTSTEGEWHVVFTRSRGLWAMSPATWERRRRSEILYEQRHTKNMHSSGIPCCQSYIFCLREVGPSIICSSSPPPYSWWIFP